MWSVYPALLYLLTCRWRTSDPPRLPIEHPVRRAFYRHGLVTARHWLLAMLVSVAIAVFLTYPTVFLSDFPTAGLSGLPYHVWASHKLYEGPAQRTPDLEMRQIWIHGNYMKALEKSVLKEALTLQHSILGEATTLTGPAHHHPSRVNWGWQSPMMYWNSSHDLLENDQDIVKTVNGRACQPSFLNSTLRPLSVFAGKDFSGTKLAAADALVISLFTRVNDTMSETWHQNLLRLANDASGPSSKYHISGSVEGSKLYEYRFQPLTLPQNFALAIAYGIIALYVAVSLRRLKAFHSRFGLVVTALTQITSSILASFTVCGLLGINLAQIPREAYPFVVLVIGLENIFRFINAVLAYPPEMMNTQRIANGLGDIGMASVGSAAQNLLILWVMSMVVSPGVAAFCVFAAVALLFDYFFLFTFFLAVLSVDIRRLELQDSIRLSRGSARPRVKKLKVSRDRHSWIDALVQGRVPFSTRMAGSVVTISFVLVLNWHFTDHSSPSTSLGAFPGLIEKQGLPTTEFEATPFHLANTSSRHQGSWLRTQDYENAVHFMKVISPEAIGFTARIFDPVIVVLSGSDRSGVSLQRTWSSALRSVALRHFYPVAMVAVFVVAFVTVLMNFLLWDERAEGAELDTGIAETPPLAVDPVHTNHHLDVIKIAGCRSGHILSAGIDRSISIALYDYRTNTYSNMALTGENAALIRWPVQNCVIDGPSEWMALICEGGQVLLGILATAKFTHNFQLKSEEKILAYRFIPPAATSKGKSALFVAMHADGSLSECSTEHDTCQSSQIFQEEVCTARFAIAESYIPELVVQNIRGQIISYRRLSGVWRFHLIRNTEGLVPKGIMSSLTTVSGVEASFLCMTDRLVVLNPGNPDHFLLQDVPNTPARISSFEILYTGRDKCSACKASTIDTLSFAYSDAEVKDCVIQTLASPGDEGDPLNPSTLHKLCHECATLGLADIRTQRLIDPGAWEATAEVVLGLRQRPEPALPPTSKNTQDNILRRRRQNTTTSQTSNDDTEQWEAYMFSASGELNTVPIDNSTSENYLYATRAGPACRLGPRAVAIALGSTIYVIQQGNDRLASIARRSSEGTSLGAPSRRRLTNRKGQ